MGAAMSNPTMCPLLPSVPEPLAGFDFLGLPPEIRFMIYDLLLPKDVRLSKLAYIDDIRVTRTNPQQTPTFPRTLPEHACLQHWDLAAFGGNRPFHARWARNRPKSLRILSINHQIREEACGLFYGRSRLWLQHDNDLRKIFLRLATLNERPNAPRKGRDKRHLMLLRWIRQFSNVGVLVSIVDMVPRYRAKRNLMELPYLHGCLEILLRPSPLEMPIADNASPKTFRFVICGPHLHFDESRCHFTIPLDDSTPALEDLLGRQGCLVRNFELVEDGSKEVWIFPADSTHRRREFLKVSWKGSLSVSGAEDRKIEGLLVKSQDKPA